MEKVWGIPGKINEKSETEDWKLKIPAAADELIEGGTIRAVQEAKRLSRLGRSVIMAIRETWMETDAEFSDIFCRDPDGRKKRAEEQLQAEGVIWLYGVTVAWTEKTGNGTRVYLTSKGGIFEVLCTHFSSWDYGKPVRGIDSCRMPVKEEGENETVFLDAPFFWDERKTTAENLLAGRRKLLERFEKEQKEKGNLRMGRILQRSAGMCGRSAASENPGYGRKKETEQWDVIVAGGGTAGTFAALYAARAGARTLLLEPQYELGGTGTAGGVSTYWFGTRFREVREIDRKIDRIHRKLGLVRRKRIWSEQDDSHPAVRSYVLLKSCIEAGVCVRLGRFVWDVIRQGERAVGVRSAGDGGCGTDFGRLLIDATGDGDLAVFAGAGSVYGSERDGLTYWASLAQYTDLDTYKNNFSSMVRLDDPADVTRFVTLGRKRGGEVFDHGGYLSVRESRHIQGKYTVNLKDVCCFRTYQDGLYTCYSNYDPKGMTDADMICCGWLPPQNRIQIPLSALLPTTLSGEQIKGLYVAGKAVSATHNAFPGIRMQTDLMHQGAVLGMLCAEALRQGKNGIEEIPDEERRRVIREVTGDRLEMPRQPYGTGEKSWEDCINAIGPDTRTHWVDVPFTYEEKEMNPLTAAVCAPAEKVLPAVRKKIRFLESGKQTEGEKRLLLMLKRLALWHGCDDYTEELAARAEKILAETDGLPEREGSVVCVQLLPDHGVMPELVYDLNLLANSRTHFSISPFRIVCDRLETMDRDYRDIRKGIYCYAESVAYVAGKTGRSEFVPLLRRLQNLPEFTEAMQPERQENLMSERLQILYLEISRALMKNGSPDGEEGLKKLERSGGAAVRYMVHTVRNNREETQKQQREHIW